MSSILDKNNRKIYLNEFAKYYFFNMVDAGRAPSVASVAPMAMRRHNLATCAYLRCNLYLIKENY